MHPFLRRSGGHHASSGGAASAHARAGRESVERGSESAPASPTRLSTATSSSIPIASGANMPGAASSGSVALLRAREAVLLASLGRLAPSDSASAADDGFLASAAFDEADNRSRLGPATFDLFRGLRSARSCELPPPPPEITCDASTRCAGLEPVSANAPRTARSGSCLASLQPLAGSPLEGGAEASA